MPKFLFAFGFESPETMAYNEESGDDMESSEAVFISSDSKEMAHRWGQQIANAFFDGMFAGTALKPSVNDYANWIVDDPNSEYETSVLNELHCVNEGQEGQLRSVVEKWLDFHNDE